MTTSSEYDAEMHRLTLQADVMETQPTRWLFQRAGIGPGMRVLDAGCGVGDVALLVAELVGPTGAVVGVDVSPRSLATARYRVELA